MDIYIVSDLHMGDGSPADNFSPIKERFEQFLDMVEKQEEYLLVLNGDIFEIWQCRMGKIVIEYQNILERLMKMNTVFLTGNHDIDLVGMNNVPGCSDFFDKFEQEMVIQKEGQEKITIMHGHTMDVYNDPNKSLFVGRIMSLLMGGLEKAFPRSGVEGYTQKYIEPVVRNIAKFFLSIYQKLFVKNHKNNPSTHLESMDAYRKNNPEGLVIAGHTHRPGWYENWYVNTGTWQEDENSYYAKISDNGKVRLYGFPSNKEIGVWEQCGGTEFSGYSIKRMWENRND